MPNLSIISVVGARPNFMKVAPIHKAFKKYADVRHLICHTGQHYDETMSKVFFDELELPKPDFYLGVGSGSHAEQTAKIMVGFERVVTQNRPDVVIVVGDVNSTIACSLVAAKLGIPVAHIEAGLRSFDRSMPEEINRVLTDSISDFLFVTEQSGIENLKREGISEKKIHFVGNVMIDSLVHYMPKAERSDALSRFRVDPAKYIVATFHRPANVDTQEGLKLLLGFLKNIASRHRVVFPVHPRTRSNIRSFSLESSVNGQVSLSEPVGYLDFLWLMKNAALVVTDSGGIQEETTYMGVPCITIRDNTERPVTVEQGTNYLTGTNLDSAEKIARDVLSGKAKKGKIPELWDGKAAERIVEIIHKTIAENPKS
ncbi:MAG: UDP-N-acetylglucosamine 2-epimerase (non-hydrolyzing) [Bacteroidota bacterium]